MLYIIQYKDMSFLLEWERCIQEGIRTLQIVHYLMKWIHPKADRDISERGFSNRNRKLLHNIRFQFITHICCSSKCRMKKTESWTWHGTSEISWATQSLQLSWSIAKACPSLPSCIHISPDNTQCLKRPMIRYPQIKVRVSSKWKMLMVLQRVPIPQ